jgi:hypothetical protein
MLQSRWTIFAAWSLTFVVAAVCIVFLPIMRPKYFSVTQLGGALLTVGQTFIPLLTTILICYFPEGENEATGRLNPLTRDRFWIAFSVILVYDLIFIPYFIISVAMPSYVKVETDAESFESLLAEFTKAAAYCSLIAMIPVKWIFARQKREPAANKAASGRPGQSSQSQQR